MNSIPMSTGTSTTPALPVTPIQPVSSSTDAASGDLLAAMNPAMDAAFRIGRPTDQSGAAAILATTGSYIAGATATLDRLDEGIRRRTMELGQLQLSDPKAAERATRDLDLLQRLRDRIELSIERVTETSLGSDEAPADGQPSRRELDERAQRKREELELLEQRRLMLAPTGVGDAAHLDSTSVAEVYGAGTAPPGD